MIDKVRELSDIAHKISYDEYLKRLETEKADKVFFNVMFDQKFAELIIKECCDLITKHEYDLVPGYKQRMTAFAEICLIKEHFGVTND